MDAQTRKLRQIIKETPEKLAEAILQMDDKSASAILYDYNLWMRDSQLPPEGDDWRYWTVLSGRGFGKTYMGSAWTIGKAKENKGTILLVAATQKDLRNVMISTSPSSILELSPPDFKPEWNKAFNTLEWPNGCQAIGITSDAGGSPGSGARGHSAYAAWIDELAKFSDPKEVFLQVDLATRGRGASILTTTTPQPLDVIKMLYNKAVIDKDPLYRVVTGSTYENAANLDANYIKALKEAYAGTIAETQEIFGNIIWASDSALFKTEDIDKYRVDVAPELKRVVIAVDPAVTSNKNSDKTGIMVGGLGVDDHMYVLSDRSMKGSPSEWSRMVSELYIMYDADIIVAEKNQGGDMVMSTLQSHNKNLPVKLVTATKGKIIRAEPLSLLFEQGKIHMVGRFNTLEQQMVEYDGTQRNSPDEYDSFVWLGTELMLGKQAHLTKTFDLYI